MNGNGKETKALAAALLATFLLSACAATPEDCRPKPGEPLPDTLLCGASQPRGGT